MNLRRKCSPVKLAFAKKMRKAPTVCEDRLWQELRAWRYAGVRFRRQVVIRGYIVDFYCPKVKLAIEVDGLSHDKQKDDVRDRNIAKVGISTIRFTNQQVIHRLGDVLETIGKVFRSRRIWQRIRLTQRRISTNPQRVRLQQQGDHNSLRVFNNDDDEHSGNVGIPPSDFLPKDLADAKPCGRYVDAIGKNLKVCFHHPKPVVHDTLQCPACSLEREQLA